MNLWIRSQDKKLLIPINNALYIPQSRTGENFGIFYKDIMLGYYTKERALEVLDEIHSLLNPIIKYNQNIPIETIQDRIYQLKQYTDIKIHELSTCVYEMPKE